MENNNGLDPENENLLNELDDIFRIKREKTFIEKIVNDKISKTNFAALDTAAGLKNKTKPIVFWIFGLLLLSSAVVWGVFTLKNNSAASPAIKPNTVAQALQAPSAQLSDRSESVSKDAGKSNSEIVLKKDEILKSSIDSSYVVSTKIPIKPGEDYNVLAQDMVDILVNQGLKAKTELMAGKLMYVISKDNIAPSRVNGKFVKYSVLFEIEPSNPSSLKLSLIYEQSMKSNFMVKGSTMEEKFYDKLVPALKNYFQKRIDS